jgi:acetoin utilization deacetylase AcuC-like enzyme
MGFCLLANVALAARHLQEKQQVQRLLIVDYDVHHGNGTQDIFYDDPGVLFISTHQSPLYPGTGRLEEIGLGLGEGTTLNVPLRPGYGDAAYARVFDEIVWPAARRFRPEMILVSAGFDAHWDDPLASMTLTLTGFDHLTRALIGMAEALCGGRIVFLLEGGYSLNVAGPAVCNVAHALLGEVTVHDPLALPDRVPETLARLPDIGPLIHQIRAVHGLDA